MVRLFWDYDAMVRRQSSVADRRRPQVCGDQSHAGGALRALGVSALCPRRRGQTRDWNFCQTVQRRKIVASCGEEIGLKAASHPTGIFARDRKCWGVTGNPSSSCEFEIGATSGRRSPLSVRSTLGELPVNHRGAEFGNDGNATKPATKEANATLAKRTKRGTRIGQSPNHQSPRPRTRRTDWLDAIGNVDTCCAVPQGVSA